MLGRIAPILVRRRKAVIGLWALFFVVSIAFGSGVIDKLETDAEGKHGTEAGRVLDELEALGQNQPDTSVTDAHGRVHGLDNVYVADGSVFVTSGAHNPTNTIMAVALRNMRHLAGG